MGPLFTRWTPAMAPVGFSVVILYLRSEAHTHAAVEPADPSCESGGDSHGLFVPAGSSVRHEGETPGGGVIERHADAPQVHAGAVRLLMRPTQHRTLVHVWVLGAHAHTRTHVFRRQTSL